VALQGQPGAAGLYGLCVFRAGRVTSSGIAVLENGMWRGQTEHGGQSVGGMRRRRRAYSNRNCSSGTIGVHCWQADEVAASDLAGLLTRHRGVVLGEGVYEAQYN